MPLRRLLASLAILVVAASTVTLALAGRQAPPAAPGSQASADATGTQPANAAGPSRAPGAQAPVTGSSNPDEQAGDPASPMSDHLSGDVYGFLPYWEMDDTIEAAIEWNALATLSVFSVGAGKDGTLISSAAGHKAIVSERGRRILATAKSRGVRTEITFTSFGRSRNAAFFGNTDAQATTIREIRALVRDVGAEGVNVDVELIDETWYPAYASFCGRLRAALRRDNPRATVSVSTAIDGEGAKMARAAVEAGADRVFLMGYVYRWAGSTPGAIAPMDFRDLPTQLDIPGSLDLYAANDVPADRLILGLPLYGRTWPTTGPRLGDKRTGDGATFIPRRNLDLLAERAAAGAINYDAFESVEWFARKDPATGKWSQTFYDSPRSLKPKLRLAVARGLAGVGFWALGYERGLPGYWDLVKNVYGPPKLLGARAPARSATRDVPVSISLVGGSRPLSGVQFSADGKRWGAPLAVPPLPEGGAPSAWRRGLTWTLRRTGDGPSTVWVRALDEVGTLSRARSVVVVLDTTGPVLPARPVVGWVSARGAWRVRWAAARDGAGVAGYRVRLHTGSGAWKMIAERTTAPTVLLRGVRRGTAFVVQIRAVDRLGNFGIPRYVRNSP